MAFYRCSYILRTGKVCNRGCYRPEGCKVHWDSPPRIPCKECGKLTYSGYDYCEKAREDGTKIRGTWKKYVVILSVTSCNKL